MRQYLSKLKTQEKSPRSLGFQFSGYSGLGGFLAISTVALLTIYTEHPFLMAPFGATCVLAFGVPNSPLAQPRNIIGGHIVATLVGLICLYLFGNEWYSLAIGVGLAISLMQLTGTTHPPAGADPIVVILGAKTLVFVINPVLFGAVVITIIALIFNNISGKRKYPVYWR
ncbi:HPP family protein [Ancylomarina salipaludis]|uniref:HPP family protein n=1 Tax=Ancylomarina salipaludis TaxID=2501299 RepID=A0A4V1N039_9BACT|nr:HPP family protein [Ancylomarina salipaludis]RXQ94441.1 HPP family protein [Ancylomarina salipaludis]